MSAEEDVELRDLLAQTLESNGCLSKIRAQLRASIFLALDEDVKISKRQPLLNNKVKTYLETDEGKAMFCIVRDFLEFFGLDVTMSVFEPESYMGSGYQFEGREKIVNDLGLDILEDTTVPFLLQLIKIAQAKTNNLKIDLNINSNDSQGSKSLSLEIDTSNKLTNSIDSTLNKSHSIISDEHSEAVKTSLQTTKLDLGQQLNTTFEVHNPTINFNLDQEVEGDATKKLLAIGERNSTMQILDIEKEGKDDDTYEETISSIPEDVTDTNYTNNSKVSKEINPDTSIQEISKETESLNKSKISNNKSEKSICKNSLSSLSDLPPLQLSKPRANNILPSLYSREFKDKSNLRELDKLFDMDEAEYEEDFICSSDELSLKSDYLKSDCRQASNKTSSSEKSSSLRSKDIKQKIPNRISDVNKPLLKTLVNNTKDVDRKNRSSNNDERGSISSLSENIEISTSD